MLSPELATSALAAARDRGEQPVVTLASAARAEPNLLPVQPPIGVVPIGQPPVVIHPVAPQPVVTPPPIVVAPPVINRPPVNLPPVIGTILDPPTGPPVVVQLPGTDQRLVKMRQAYITGVDRFVQPGLATTLPAAAGLDLDGARTALLAGLHPATTVATLAAARVPVIAGMMRPDPVAPIMAGPVFTDAAYTPFVRRQPRRVRSRPRCNPTRLRHARADQPDLHRRLPWRGSTARSGTSCSGAATRPTSAGPTGTASGARHPDIGPLHLFHGTLPDNVTSGTQPLLVLILRGRLLKRYPDSDIYAVIASTDPTGPEPIDTSQIVRPIFRDFVDPDITLVGFPLTYDEVVGATGGPGYWFVIAEHPGQPRFGLTDPDPTITHPPLPTWDELTWPDLGSTAATATYLPTTAPSMAPAGTTRHWSGSAADMAAITYQPAVRVAIRARDLLPSTAHEPGQAAQCGQEGAAQSLATRRWSATSAAADPDLGPTRSGRGRRHGSGPGKAMATWTAAQDRIRKAIQPIDPADLFAGLDAQVPLALLPVRLETRFADPGTDVLHVRIFPDDAHIDGHDSEITDTEATLGACDVGRPRRSARDGRGCACRPAAARHLGRAARRAGASSSRLLGGPRAAWVAHATRPATDGTPHPHREAAGLLRPPVARALPDRWVVRAYVGGAVVGEAWTSRSGSTCMSHPIRPPCRTARRARRHRRSTRRCTGWSTTRPPSRSAWRSTSRSPGTQAVDRVVAVGVRASATAADSGTELANLLTAHRYTDGFGVLPVGSPTSNSPDARSAADRHADPIALWQQEFGPPAAAGTAAAQLASPHSGCGPGIVDGSESSASTGDASARAMQTATWAATWGYYLGQLARSRRP